MDTLNMNVKDEVSTSGSLWSMAGKRLFRHKLAVSGFACLCMIVLFVIIGSLMVNESSAMETDLSQIGKPPSVSHPFGTDEVGRDVLVRIIYGGRISLLVGACSMIISVAAGTLAGILSGYYGGMTDTIIMRITDIMLSIPMIFFLIILAVVLGPSVPTIIIVIGILSWMNLARIVRGEVLSIKNMEYCQGAVAQGAGDLRIIIHHIIPNIMPQIIVSATLNVGSAILTESSLSYLGLGIQPPTASWGNMLKNAQSLIWSAPWTAVFPGIFILLTVLSINFIGDGLRDALDPKLHRS